MDVVPRHDVDACCPLSSPLDIHLATLNTPTRTRTLTPPADTQHTHPHTDTRPTWRHHTLTRTLTPTPPTRRALAGQGRQPLPVRRHTVHTYGARAAGGYTRPLYGSIQAYFVGHVGCMIPPQSIRQGDTVRCDQNG